MHIFTTTDRNKQALESFKSWLDNKKLVWTESGDEIRIFNLDDSDTEKVNNCAGVLFTSYALAYVSAPVPASVPVDAPSNNAGTLSWYQFTAVLAAVSGKAYKLGELDTPVRWSADLDGGEFLFQVKRVSYTETTRRYKVTKTELVYTRVYRENNKWEVDEIHLPLEKAGDLVKFGGVTTPELYWQRRLEAAAHLDWTTPALARVLARATAPKPIVKEA